MNDHPTEIDQEDEGNPAARPLVYYDAFTAAQKAARSVGEGLLAPLEQAFGDYLSGTFEECLSNAELWLSAPCIDVPEWSVIISLMPGNHPSAVWSLDSALTRLAEEMADPALMEDTDVGTVPALADMLERHAAALRAAAAKRNKETDA